MNKPAFDPNQPFEEVKPKFDSSQPFTDASPKADEAPGKLESLGRGALQGATFGLSDEAAGGVEALGQLAGLQGLSSPFKTGVSSRKEGSTGLDLNALLNAYKQGRDEERAANFKAKEANPMTYLGGELAGGFAVPAGIVGSELKAATTLGEKAIQGAKAGAALGAIGGVGNSTADLTKGEVGDFSKDVVGSTVLGGGLGAGVSAIAPAAGNKLDDVLSNFKAYQIMKRAGQASAEGTELLGKEAREGLNKQLRRHGEDFIQTLDQQHTDIGKEMNVIKKKPTVPVMVDNTIQEITDSLPMDKIFDPDDLKTVDKIKQTLDNVIQKVERKEPVFTPVGDVAKISNSEKAMNRVNQIVASDNKKTYDTFARYLVAKSQNDESQLVSLAKSLDNMGVDTSLLTDAEGKMTPEVSDMIQKMNSPEDIANLSSELQNHKILPDPKIVQERDMQTGLDVIRAVRGNSTKSITVPPDVEKFVSKLKLKWEPTTVVNRPSIDGQTIQAAADTLKKYAADIDPRSPLKEWAFDAAKKISSRLPESMDQADIDALSGLNTKYRSIGEAKAKLGISNRYDESWDEMGSQFSKEKDLANKFQNYFEGDSQNAVSINDSLDKLGEVDPQAADTFRKNIKQSGLDLATSRALTAEGLGHGSGALNAVTQVSTKTIPSLVSYGAGKAIRAVTKEAPDKIVSMGKALYNAAPEHLQGFADQLAQKGSPYADKLRAALAQPMQKRNALIFTLMQQPGFRQDAHDLGGYLENKIGIGE